MADLGYTAFEIAKWFINAADREAGDAMTHLKVQKLVYYAQGWSLALLGKPLFSEDLQAWAHGPVAPSVWKQLAKHGFDSIPEQKMSRKIDGDVGRLLSSVNKRYGIFSAKRLERMTHEESPWQKARGDLAPEAKSTAAISKTEMKRFFGALKERAA